MDLDVKISEIEKLTGSDNQYWICGHAVGEFLYEKVLEVKPQNVLEFGTSVGYSALWMAKALRETGGRLFTVESHRERGDLAEGNFRGLEDVITLVRGHAPEVLSEDVFNGVIFDLIFFDATKYEHLSYFEAVYPRLRDGGFLIVDNVISHGEGKMMQKFLDAVKNHPRMTSEVLDLGSGILVAQKN